MNKTCYNVMASGSDKVMMERLRESQEYNYIHDTYRRIVNDIVVYSTS